MASSCQAVIVHPAFPIQLHKRNLVSAACLPRDVLHRIAAMLGNAQDLCHFEEVCKACRDVAREQGLWRQLCMAKFIIPSYSDIENWKEMYKFHHHFFYRVLLSQAAQDLGRYSIGAQPLRLAVLA